MSVADRNHWDGRYEHGGMAPLETPRPPPVFAGQEDLFPNQGFALELACGRGRATVWLASRGMEVFAVDVSPVAIDLAERLAHQLDVSERCRFEVVDLDEGLPPGPQVDLVLCHLFRDASLDQAIVDRLAPGGLIAIATLSEVGAGPGPFRAGPGELRHAFAQLETVETYEGNGTAWLIAQQPG